MFLSLAPFSRFSMKSVFFSFFWNPPEGPTLKLFGQRWFSFPPELHPEYPLDGS